MKNVCILMSTYNGEKFIRTQIDSILRQKEVKVHIVIRDDGSTDDTVNIINEYKDNITLIQGNNLGCEGSFMELLHYKYDADYYAFSDQDDYWYDEKIIMEIRAIESKDGPALAACNLLACDELLQPIRVIHSENVIRKIPEMMKKCVVVNMHGCVLLWNKKLHVLVQEYRPNIRIFHDGWVNAIANAIGYVAVLPEPLILYRLHSNNLCGYGTNVFKRIKKGLRVYFGKKHPKRDLIAKEILAGYKKYMDMETEGYRTLLVLMHYKESYCNKIKLLQTNLIHDKPFPERVVWEMCVLMGRY